VRRLKTAKYFCVADKDLAKEREVGESKSTSNAQLYKLELGMAFEKLETLQRQCFAIGKACSRAKQQFKPKHD